MYICLFYLKKLRIFHIYVYLNVRTPPFKTLDTNNTELF